MEGDFHASNPAEDTSSSGGSDDERYASDAAGRLDDVEEAEPNPAEDSFGVPDPNPYLLFEGGTTKVSDEVMRRRLFLRSLRPGQQLDVLDSVSKWAEAEVLHADHARGCVEITYLYWSDRWNEWISYATEAGAARLAEVGTRTFQEGGVLQLDHRVECLDDVVWREAVVVDVAPREVKVHFMKWHSKFDEWLPRDSPRIRPFGRKKRVALVKQQESRKRRQPLFQPTGPAGVPEKRERTISSLSDCYTHYVSALEKRGLFVHQVEGDGNCLFRAVAHQVYGDAQVHKIVRAACCDYMEREAEFFEQFIEGDRSDFLRYLSYKRLNAVWGDDPEVQALCEIYDRPAEIWAYDHRTGARKLRTFHEPYPSAEDDPRRAAPISRGGDERAPSPAAAGSDALAPPPAPSDSEASPGIPARPPTLAPMRLSYYGGGHYDSIVTREQVRMGPRPSPGVLEAEALRRGTSREPAAGRGEASRLGPAQRHAGDGGKEEEAELDLALEASRLDFDAQFEDLDAALSVSVESYEKELGDVSQRVQRQSEEEMLKAAMEASMEDADGKPTAAGDGLEMDEAFLKAAMEASAREADTAGDSDDAVLLAAMAASRAVAQADTGDADAALQRALLASQEEGDEDAVLQMALQASMQDGYGSAQTSPYAGALGAGDEDDEEELQRALELSCSDR